VAEHKHVYRDADGVRRTAIWDDDDPSKLTVKTEVDLTQAIENNKIVRELHPRRGTNKLVGTRGSNDRRGTGYSRAMGRQRLETWFERPG
jgi:hypothetical protein